MALWFVLKSREPLCLDGVADDHLWQSVSLMTLAESPVQIPQIMSVAADDLPAEGTPFCLKVIQGQDLCNRTVKLKLVVVGNNNEVVQTLGLGEHGRLPVLALLRLTVSDYAVCPLVRVFQLGCICNSACCGDSLPQRSCAHVYSRCLVAVAMAWKPGAALIERVQPGHGKISLLGQNGIKRGPGVSLRHHQHVPVLTPRIIRIKVTHLTVQKIRQNLDN